MTPQLVLTHKRYSSWSLRGWLALRQADIAFEEVFLPLRTEEYRQRIHDYSPSGQVPALVVDGANIWDSLAILEWAAERANLWPADPKARAVARSMVAEMHAGFRDLRLECPMNLGRRYQGFVASDGVMANVARICAMWRERLDKGGEFLFGDYGAADIFYAPVVTRFATYDLVRDPGILGYMARVEAQPAMEEWTKAARAETVLVPQNEFDLPERD